ncbi:HlyC/CorC family transporter [Anabaena aphanizomenioides LEGE 00250]|uniref:HlyC/CorC family transporter n=1 Tax=Sphaerospermopsis aphanizomenoides LEGE 00250 TaxID=2777972 RepID=A0ABR9VL85_9CYAN|nr:hemolysin family protein [Sphaerospermopsis aphanizomenoides]MBE9239256.1 HlyC/CorC family transporter [Sphaerospermopsis aphanizomenoides LEGE 00250]
MSAFSQLIWTDIGFKLLSVLLLIAINAFFVTAEFSMVTVRRTRIHQLVQAGDIPAIAVEMLQRSIDRLLSTAQLGITLSSLALGWIGESGIVVIVNAWLQSWPLPGNLSNFLAHSLSIPITFFLIAYLQIVLGELFPKSVAMLYSEQLARFLGPSVKAIVRFFSPVIWILNQSTRYLLKLFGIEYTGQSWRPPVTPEELQLIISTERESTGLELAERELLNNVFEFGEITAQDVMIPRTSIITLPEDATFQTLLQEMTSTGHSLYPIIGESLDDIRGIVYFQDLATPLSQGKMTLETQIYPWIRPPRFVPEQTLLSELLPMMQQEKPAMVIVVDEFGATVGIVTIQDVIAEIIGNAGEPTVTDDLLVQMSEKQTFLVQAQINLEELNEVLHINLPLAREYQTLGGFVLYQLQRIPAKGEIFNYENLEFTIVSVSGPRLHQIEIRIL